MYILYLELMQKNLYCTTAILKSNSGFLIS